MQVVRSLKPRKRFAEPYEMFIALQNHQKCEFMCHEMLSNGFIAILAFFALGIRLHFFLLGSFNGFIIVHSNELHVNFYVLC